MDTIIEGRIVHYVITDEDALSINFKRRIYPSEIEGNTVVTGSHFPAIITRVFHNEFGEGNHGVNLQVFLDGNDSLWVKSVTFADPSELLLGTYHWPERE